MKPAFQQYVEGSAKPSGSSRSLYLIYIDVKILFDETGEMLHPFVQQMYLFVGSSFLPGKDIGGSLWPVERILYIASYGKTCFLQSRMQEIEVNTCDVLHDFPSLSQFVSFFIVEPCTECLHHAHACIVGGTSSDTDNEPSESLFQSLLYQFSRTVCAGLHRIPFGGRECGQAVYFRHFDNSGLLIAQYAVACCTHSHEWVVGAGINDLSLHGIYQCVEHAFSSVSNRDRYGLALRVEAMYFFCYTLLHFF
ncbi:unknown [Bacteroides sp. CAG:702]|nr:unknown [Bacteroides sp. CAG:702]